MASQRLHVRNFVSIKRDSSSATAEEECNEGRSGRRGRLAQPHCGRVPVHCELQSVVQMHFERAL
jgi:hypothetical protein